MSADETRLRHNAITASDDDLPFMGDVTRSVEEARLGLRTSEMALLAGRHLSIQQCAGGHCIVAGGPCDHCGSIDPTNDCQFVKIGEPLITR